MRTVMMNSKDLSYMDIPGNVTPDLASGSEVDWTIMKVPPDVTDEDLPHLSVYPCLLSPQQGMLLRDIVSKVPANGTIVELNAHMGGHALMVRDQLPPSVTYHLVEPRWRIPNSFWAANDGAIPHRCALFIDANHHISGYRDMQAYIIDRLKPIDNLRIWSDPDRIAGWTGDPIDLLIVNQINMVNDGFDSALPWISRVKQGGTVLGVNSHIFMTSYGLANKVSAVLGSVRDAKDGLWTAIKHTA